MTNCAKRTGFTLPEFLIALLCVVILLGLFVSLFSRGLVTPREQARRVMCSNNLRNLALAAISYESSHQELPIGVGIEDQNGVLQTNPVSGLHTATYESVFGKDPPAASDDSEGSVINAT